MVPDRRTFLAAVAASLAIPRAAEAQRSLQTLRIATSPDDGVMPVLYAERTGAFAAAGLDIELQKLNSGSAVAAAVAGGAADIGRSSMLPLINGHARGLPFVVVAASTMHVPGDPDSAIIVSADSPVRGARDLTGTTVAVAGLFDLSWLATNVWLDKSGGDSSAVKFVEIPNSAMLAALGAGRVQAGTLSEPFMSLDVRSGKARMLADVTASIAARMVEAGWFTTTSYVRDHRDAVFTFRSVVERAAAYTNVHHAETVDLLVSFSGLDPATIALVSRSTTALSLDAASVQPLIDAAARYKQIPSAFPARDLLL